VTKYHLNLWFLSILLKRLRLKVMSRIRRNHKPEFKFKVAWEALKEQKTIVQICREFEVCESQVNNWKKRLRENGSDVFIDSSRSSKSSKIGDLEAQIRSLNEYIGELSVENKFFKKNSKF
jgi:transposase